MKNALRATAATLVLTFVGAAPALADRDPTAEERTSIENALKGEGFTQWSDIDWDDDGYWEVDDAIAADGKKYDLRMDAQFAVTQRDLDD